MATCWAQLFVRLAKFSSQKARNTFGKRLTLNPVWHSSVFTQMQGRRIRGLPRLGRIGDRMRTKELIGIEPARRVRYAMPQRQHPYSRRRNPMATAENQKTRRSHRTGTLKPTRKSS